MTMTFKEALIAHLQGEKVEVSGVSTMPPWRPLMEYHGGVPMRYIDDPDFAGACEYRIAPNTILVNGVEVPAPQKDAPLTGTPCFLPFITTEGLYTQAPWRGVSVNTRWLERGLVYLDKESAIARAKAMLITQEVK